MIDLSRPLTLSMYVYMGLTISIEGSVAKHCANELTTQSMPFVELSMCCVGKYSQLTQPQRLHVLELPRVPWTGLHTGGLEEKLHGWHRNKRLQHAANLGRHRSTEIAPVALSWHALLLPEAVVPCSPLLKS